MPLSTPLAKIFRLKPKQEALPGIELSKEIPAKGWSSLGKEKRKWERKSRKNGRWAILILFFLTVFACLFFYFQVELPRLWQKAASPAIISSLPEEAVFDSGPVLGQIETLVKNLRGEYGVFVYRLDSGESYGVKGEDVFPAASLIKLPVMLTVYQEAEKGNSNLEDYRDKLEAMGKRSDNNAFNQVVKTLGATKIQKTIDDLAMNQTSFAENKTSPADIGLFFRELYGGRLIADEHKDEFLGFLTDTIYEDRIPAGIPDNVRVAHKIGTETGAFSDAGIIFAEKPFVLVVMSDGARESEAKEVIPKIAKAVWEFENPK